MAAWCRNVAESERFQLFVVAVIVFNAALMGLETSRSLMAAYGPLFSAVNLLVQAVFVFEIVVRIAACAPRPLRFFREGWNLFDFTVVVLSLLPIAGPFASVARLARLLRVVRLVSAVPDLRLIVSTLLGSLPSMGHVVLLLGLLIYVYAILGFYLFSPHDPRHWGTLGASLLTVFQLLTLEGWVEMQGAVLPALPWAWMYFASFVIVGVFVVINLFIAVVLNNLENARAEQQRESDAVLSEHDLLDRIEALKADLDRFEAALRQRVAPPPERR